MKTFKIYTTKPIRTDSVENLLSDYIIKYNCPETFFEVTPPNGIQMQCESGLRRSFYDLLSLVKHYIPTTSEEEVAFVLCNMLKKEKIGCLYCGTIHKIVFYLNKGEYIANWTYVYDKERDIFMYFPNNYGFAPGSGDIGIDNLSINSIYNLSKQYEFSSIRQPEEGISQLSSH